MERWCFIVERLTNHATMSSSEFLLMLLSMAFSWSCWTWSSFLINPYRYSPAAIDLVLSFSAPITNCVLCERSKGGSVYQNSHNGTSTLGKASDLASKIFEILWQRKFNNIKTNCPTEFRGRQTHFCQTMYSLLIQQASTKFFHMRISKSRPSEGNKRALDIPGLF